MNNELETGVKEILYENFVSEMRKLTAKDTDDKSWFFEVIDLELMEEEGKKRGLITYKWKSGKYISIKNLKMNIFKLIENIIEICFTCYLLDEKAIYCIVSLLKTIFDTCMLQLGEEDIVIILALYYTGREQKITDNNLCDTINYYMKMYMGVRLPEQRIYQEVKWLSDIEIVEILDGKYTIRNQMVKVIQ